MMLWGNLDKFIESGWLPYPYWVTDTVRKPLLWNHLPYRNNDYRSLLDGAEDAVKRTLTGIDRVGILFSGGVDSSLLAYLASKYAKVTLYTLDFGMYPDEMEPATRTAEHLKLPIKSRLHTLDHHYSLLEQAIRNLDAPGDIDTQVLSACRMAELNGEKVILSALGMDEVQAGYPAHVKVAQNYFHLTEEEKLNECHAGYAWRNSAQRLSLDMRFPFLDERFVGYALNRPLEYKRRGSETKVGLREELHRCGCLPETVVEAGRVAGTKRGFTPLLRGWWSQGLGDWCLEEIKSLPRDLAQRHRRRFMEPNTPSWKTLRLANTGVWLRLRVEESI